MIVILLQDVGRLGNAGDVKRVADGYARNYLLPRGIAVVATEGARKQVAARAATKGRPDEGKTAQTEAQAADLEGVELVFKARAAESGRLYGSVTSANIAELLSEKLGTAVNRRRVLLEEPIRQIGESKVDIRLSSDVNTTITVVVEPEAA